MDWKQKNVVTTRAKYVYDIIISYFKTFTIEEERLINIHTEKEDKAKPTAPYKYCVL